MPLVCFHIVELHCADRVLHQFGMRQGIPVDCDTDKELHKIDLRGRTSQSWVQTHLQWIAMWDNRQQFVVRGEPWDGVTDYHDPYMSWYRSITRRWISSTGGFHDFLVSSHNLFF